MRRLLKREKLFINWIDRFILLNQSAYEYFGSIAGKNKVKLIYDGIDYDDFTGAKTGLFRKELSLAFYPVIGVIGRIIPGKGQKEFILSAKEVLKLKPQAKFVIVGEAKGDSQDYYQEVRTLVKKERLEENIIFTGWRNDVKNIIADLDVLAFPTTTFPEGLPNTIIEAMALKKPVVATNIPGPSDIVVDGETGFLVPPADIKAMADKITYLLDNPQVAQKMGEKGRERASQYFDIKASVRGVEEVYRKILMSSRKNKYLYNSLKAGIGSFLYYSGIFSIFINSFKRKKQCFIFMYHRINKDDSSVFQGLPVQAFEKQIRFIKRFFRVINFNELLNYNNQSMPRDRNLAIITFDDGYKSTYINAFPILEKYGIAATVFLTTGILDNGKLLWTDGVSYLIRKTTKPTLSLNVNGVSRIFALDNCERIKVAEEIKGIMKNIDNNEKERVLAEMSKQLDINFSEIPENEKMLSWTEVKEMSKDGIDFGAHTVNHPILSRIDPTTAKKEIMESKNKIEVMTGLPVITFCYPNGQREDFNETTKQILKQSGFKFAVTAIEGKVNASDDFLSLKRISLGDRSPALIIFKLFKEIFNHA